MSRWHWSVTDEEIIERTFRKFGIRPSPEQIVRAAGREYRISWKKAIETARFIKYWTIKQAQWYLEQVVKLKMPIPIRSFIKKQAHHATPWRGWPVAKWPVKVAKAFLEVLQNLENNAIYKGLDVNRVVLIHVATHKGRKIWNWMPRAFGRATPWVQDTVHIEMVGVELPPDNVPKRLRLVPFK